MVNTKCIHMCNVILNNTVTKFVTLLTKCFFSISEPYKYLKENWVNAMTSHNVEPNTNIIDKKTSFWRQTVKSSVNDIIALFKLSNIALFVELYRRIERMVNLNVTCLILFLVWFRSFTCTISLGEEGGRLKLNVQG